MDSQKVDSGAVGQTSAKEYPSNVVSGGTAHFGDNYHFTYGISPQQQSYERFLDSLRDPDMFARENQISETFPTTFQWIHTSDEWRRNPNSFAKWIRDSDSPFWIYGKPGSGKSTLMKFLANHQETENLLKGGMENVKPIILKFYFWISGSPSQRSVKGCLTSLLFRAALALHEIVIRYLKDDLTLQLKRNPNDWSISQLRQFLLKVLHSTVTKCCIFLDGIDEFDKDGDIDELIAIIQEWTSKHLKVCASSRPEPEISEILNVFPKLCLQDLTRIDMRKLVRGRLEQGLKRGRNSEIARSALDTIVHKIVEKTDGVSLWACLVTRDLLHGFKNGDGLPSLEMRLQMIPSKLQELYAQMWQRIRREDKILYHEEARVFLALSNFRPLSLLLFTLSVNQGLARRIIQTTEFETIFFDKIVQTCSETARKLWSHTGGLLECVEPESKRRIRPGVETGYSSHDKMEPIIPKRRAKRLDIELLRPTAQSGDQNYTLRKVSAPLCSCSFVHDGCPLSNSLYSTSRKYIHESRVDFIHQSAIEFIASSNFLESSADPDQKIYDAAYRVATGLAALRILGCGGESIWTHFNNPNDSPGGDLQPSLVEIFASIERELNTNAINEVCSYGWYHSVYLQRYTEASCPDVIGEFASRGNVDLIQELVKKQEHPGITPYYLGYLVNCAASGLEYFSGAEHNAKLCSLLIWLLEQDASAQMMHVKHVQPKRKPDSVHSEFWMRTPFDACWLGLLRLSFGTRSTDSRSAQLCGLVLKVIDLLVEFGRDHRSSSLVIVSDRNWVDLHAPEVGIIGFLAKAPTTYLEGYIRDQYHPESVKRDTTVPYDYAWVPSGLDRASVLGFWQPLDLLWISGETRIMTGWNMTQCPPITYRLFAEAGIYSQHGALMINGKELPKAEYSTVLADLGLSFSMSDKPENFEALPHLVAPHMTQDVSPTNWYEQGELREWHERRRQGLAQVSEHVEAFEEKNGLVPSYRRRTEVAQAPADDGRKRKRSATP